MIALHRSYRAATEFDTESHPRPQVVEDTGEMLWLGVRDDVRNWLLTAA